MRFLNKISETEYTMYGEIVADASYKWSDDDICPKDVLQMLHDADGKDLLIRMNSPGGDVFSGIAIYNQLKAYEGKVTVKVEGLAASIASVIAMAADEIIMPANSYMMIHRAWTWAGGNAEDLKKEAEVLERLDGTILDAYKTCMADASEESVAALKEKINAETWLSAAECKEIFGSVTVEAAEKIAACAGASDYLNRAGFKLPAGLLEAKEDETAEKLRVELELLELEMEE